MDTQNTTTGTPTPVTPQTAIDLSSLDNYYQQEFKKIIESNEKYKGKWNWYAFFFTAIWLFTKGAWMYALIIIASAAVTFGGPSYLFIVLGWALLMGWRGTWIYYNVKIKRKQFMKSLF